MKMEELKIEFDDLNVQMEEMGHKLEEMREQRNDLLRQRFDLKEQRRYFRAQMEVAKSGDNQDRVSYLTERLDQIKVQLDELDERIEAMEKQIEETGDVMEELNASTKTLEEELRNAEHVESAGETGAEGSGFSTDKIESAMNSFNLLLQKGLKRVADTLENVDLDNLGHSAKEAATKAAKTVSGAAADAAKEVGKAVNEAKESHGKAGGIGDYRVSGISVMDGGCYNRISTSGSCKVSSDLVCRELKTTGNFRACGSVDCNGETRVSGSFHCDGDMIAGDFTGTGITKVDGSLKSGLLNVPGSLTVGGDLHAGEVRVSGSLKVHGDCEADGFTASGSLEVGGMINADSVQIRLSVAESKVGSIGGAQVTVSQSASAGLLSGILRPGVGTLTCDSIEGDDLELSGVKAGTVRGNRVVIHSSCQIDQVEYSESCTISEGATVGSCTKV